jgi:hypothetical protein
MQLAMHSSPRCGAAVAVPINRWGKTRLFTLEDLSKTTDATES